VEVEERERGGNGEERERERVGSQWKGAEGVDIDGSTSEARRVVSVMVRVK
jgi:hypothetical protein